MDNHYSRHLTSVKPIQYRLLCVPILLAFSLSACSGGGGGDGDPNPSFVTTSEDPFSGSSSESSIGGSSIDSVSSNGSFTAKALPEMISSEDSSVLRNALANGQDLKSTILPTTFYCYGKQNNDWSEPIVTITVDGQNYSNTLNGQPSDSGQWTHLGENGFGFQGTEYTEFTLELTEYGQVLSWYSEEYQALADSCYQEGAAHEYALQRYAMNEPANGDYQCQDLNSGSSVGTLKLEADGIYSVDSSPGSYFTEGVVSASEDEPTMVGFTSGPFANMAANYVEDPDSGYQELLFEESSQVSTLVGSSSSSSALMTCSRKGTPRAFKKYGSAKAEDPVAPATPLSGLYVINASVLTPTQNTNDIYYADFRPNGYMYSGPPFAGGADCSLTNPAGMAYCETYQYDGNTLTLYGGPDITAEDIYTESSSGVLTKFDGLPIEPVTAFNRESLLGDWNYEDTKSGNLAMCVVGFCSGRIFKENMTFRSDGTFFSDNESYGFSSSNFVDVSSFGQSESSQAISGTFTLNGNFLTMDFANGYSVTEIVHYGFDNTILAIGERGFRKQ